MRENYLQHSADENSSCNPSESSPTDVKEQMGLPPMPARIFESSGSQKGTWCYVSIQITKDFRWTFIVAMREHHCGAIRFGTHVVW